MSQVLELRIPGKKISYKEIENILLNLGYKLNPLGEYFFYEETNFLSFGAIRASVYPYKKGKKITTSSGGLRNKFDIETQNETIRILKKQFGGYIYNDCSPGTYIQGWEDSDYNQVERACGLAYHKFLLHIIRSRLVASKYNLKDGIDKNMKGYFELTPEGNISNLLLPFLISTTEDFLKTFFIRYIEYSENGKIDYGEKIEKHFNLEELKRIVKKEILLSEIIASRYSFQNIRDIKTAYQKYLQINVDGIWKIELITFKQIIEKRHKIVHEAEFYMITNEELQKYIECINSIGRNLINYIEKRDNIRLNLNTQNE